MDFALPEIGEGVYEAELVRWLVKAGDAVRPGQPLLEVMTDKATMEVPAPFAGTIRDARGKEGDTLAVGDVILTYDAVDPAAPAKTVAPKKAKAAQAKNGPVAPALSAGRLPVKAAPSVRQMARKLGIDLAAVMGSGPGGRVLIEDLSRRVAPAPAATPRAEPRPDYGRPGTRIKLQGLRRRIAERMVHAKHTIPHCTVVEECDVSELVRLRADLKEPFARTGVPLTYLPFLARAVVAGLKEVPIVNASLDDDSGEIVLHDRYNVGIAVATPGGLVVPVVHDADKKDLATLAREMAQSGNDARAGRLKLEDLRGGTFTISSVGNVGGLMSTPLINHPEVAILAVGRIVKRPVFDEHDQVRAAHLVYLSLSFDHRVIDGAVALAFLNVLLRELKNPAAMLVPAFTA